MTNLLQVLPYLLLFVLPLVALRLQPEVTDARMSDLFWALAAIILLLFVGLRHEVGGDWPTYQRFVDRAGTLSLWGTLRYHEDGFALLNWLGAHAFGGIYFVNFMCAALAIIPTILFCRSRPAAWMALLIAIPYLIVVVFMGYTRHAAAIGLGLMAVMALEHRRFVQAFAWITLGTLLHRTGIVLLPLVLVCMWFAPKRRVGLILAAGLYAFLVSWLAYGDVLVGKLNSYIVLPVSAVITEITKEAPNDMAIEFLQLSTDTGKEAPAGEERTSVDSRGGLLRVGLGVGAGLFYFAFARRRELLPGRKPVWTTLAIANFALLPVTLLTSTLADRTALYLIPLQMHTAAALDAGLEGRLRTLFRSVTFMGSVVLLLGWFYFSDYARYWLPYKNLLL